jgi:hypothetical protein
MDDLDRRLEKLFTLIREEAHRNPAFAARLAAILEAMADLRTIGGYPPQSRGYSGAATSAPASESKRGNRRARALVDPITRIQDGEVRLRELLEPLDLEQLRDVVAEYRMDQSKLVMKWKDRERVIKHILSTALNRGRKGDAFRS